MSFDTIRPILSAMIGIAIAGWLKTKWDRWVPAKVGEKGRDVLLKEHRVTLRIANALSFSGLCIGLLCYRSGWLHDRDWRGLGIGAGLMCFLPIGYIVVVHAGRGAESIKECLVTYAISQKAPMGLLYVVMSLLFIAGLVSAVSL